MITKLPIPRFFLIFISGLIALGALSMDMYLPAMPTMREYLSGTIQEMNFTVSIFFVGYGLGQFLGGPLSDQIGRKSVGIPGLLIFLVATAWITTVTTTEQLTVLRLIQALGAGFSTIICMGSVRDAYVDEALGQRIAMTMIVMLFAPLFAPALGALLLLISWKAVFSALMLYGTVLLLVFHFFIPETRPGPPVPVSVRAMFNQYKGVLSYRRRGRLLALGYILTNAFSGMVLMVFLTTASFIYQDYFGLSANQFPLVFGVNVITIIVFQVVSMARMRRGMTRRTVPYGLGLQFSALSLLLLAIHFDTATLPVVVALLAPAVGAMGLVNPNCAAIFMTFFPKLGGSASAASTTMMFTMGMIGGGAATYFHDGTLWPIVLSMWCGCTAAIVVFSLLTVDLRVPAKP